MRVPVCLVLALGVVGCAGGGGGGGDEDDDAGDVSSAGTDVRDTAASGGPSSGGSREAGRGGHGRPGTGGSATVAACEAPHETAEDPFTLLGALDVEDDPKGGTRTHLVELRADLGRADVVWGVGTGGLYAFDAPAGSPRLLGLYHGKPGALGCLNEFYHVAPLASGRVAASHRDCGVSVFDAASPAKPKLLVTVPVGDAAGLAADGDLLRAVTHQGTFVTIDVEPGHAAKVLHVLPGLGNAWNLRVSGTRAYVADNALGLAVVDLTNREAPDLVTIVGAPAALQDVAVDGSRLFAAAGAGGVLVYDLADPDEPVLSAALDAAGPVVSVSARHGIVWAAEQSGYRAFDVTDPLAPVSLGAKETKEWTMAVLAEGDSSHHEAWIGEWSWIRRAAVDPAVLAPDLQLSTESLWFPPGTTERTFEVENLGAAPLALGELASGDPRVEVSVSSADVPPGGAATVTVTFEDDGAAPLSTTVCLASNDPDHPVVQVALAESSTGSDVALGEPAPDFVLPDTEGKTWRLSDHLGKPILLVFFASW